MMLAIKKEEALTILELAEDFHSEGYDPAVDELVIRILGIWPEFKESFAWILED